MKAKRKNNNLKLEVFTGNFPKKAVGKMGRKQLERFVLMLVERTSGVRAAEAQDFEGLRRKLFLNEADKPQWWPSDQIISRTVTPDGKYLMELMRFLVYKCCEFFKKPRENLNTEVFVTQVDQKLKRLKRIPSTGTRRRLERKCVALTSEKTWVSEVTPVKRRITLLPKNYNAQVNKGSDISQIKSPVINLQDIFYKPKSLDQDQFLKLFKLKSISSPITETIVPLPSNHTVKFSMCSHIPFSSDLGMELMRHDNHICPEVTKSRKLERLEWHINKPRISTDTEVSFPVTYQKKKKTTFHTYKFPRRQHYQQPGQFYYGEIEDVHRRYLTVPLVCQDLNGLQRMNQKKTKSKLKVVLSRMSNKRKPRAKCVRQNGGKKKIRKKVKRRKSRWSTRKGQQVYTEFF